MSDSGVPAGWYPDPENPSVSRYWDGTAWAPPSAPPGYASPPSGGGSNRTALVVIAIVAVVAVIGGGIFLLTGDDEGGGDTETLDADEFADAATDSCGSLDGDLQDLLEDAFSTADVEDFDLDAYRDEAIERLDDGIAELRSIAPEGDEDDWQELVSDLEDAYREIIDGFAGDLTGGPSDGVIEDLYDVQDEAADEFGVDCSPI